MNSHTLNNQKIKLISESFVKPKYEVEASKQPHYLAPVDLKFLSLDHMQKGLLFNTKPHNIQYDFLDKLKLSLSHSLVHFYPLAGQLATQKYHDEHAIWVYVDCIKGPGARLIHATVEFTVSDLVSSVDVHPIVPFFFDLGEKAVNHDGHTRPLLSIQVTELFDGVFVGFTMNHCIADGMSFWHFISTLSEIFLQLKDGDQDIIVDDDDDEARHIESDSSTKVKISQKPTFKPYFPEGYGPIQKLPYLDPKEFVATFDPGPLRERIFHFSTNAISMLKSKANQECGVQIISSFQALSAFIWISITRVRNLQHDLDTSCSVALNWRTKMKPPIPEDCFGNYLTGAQSKCKVGELMGRGLGWAAMLVHQSVQDLDDSKIRMELEDYVKAPYVGQTGTTSAYHRPNSVLIAGSARFDMYGPEFGLGKAVAVLAGYANKDDGKVTANPGPEGGGSVDLEVCLSPKMMDALESDVEFMSFYYSSNKAKVTQKPIFKPYFPKGYGPILKLPYLDPEEFVARFDPGLLRERTFHFSTNAILMLKAKANQECGVQSISSFQALSAFIWRSITRVRNPRPELDTSCSMALNWRARMRPPISEIYIGNYLNAAQSSCKVGDIMGRSLGWTAMLVHQSVQAVDDSKVHKNLENYVKAPYSASPYNYKPNSVLIAGSARFDMYGPEFGLGKAVAILAGYANKVDGKVTANPGREGGGSVDLEICLRPEIMDALESDVEITSFAL